MGAARALASDRRRQTLRLHGPRAPRARRRLLPHLQTGCLAARPKYVLAECVATTIRWPRSDRRERCCARQRLWPQADGGQPARAGVVRCAWLRYRLDRPGRFLWSLRFQLVAPLPSGAETARLIIVTPELGGAI